MRYINFPYSYMSAKKSGTFMEPLFHTRVTPRFNVELVISILIVEMSAYQGYLSAQIGSLRNVLNI